MPEVAFLLSLKRCYIELKVVFGHLASNRNFVVIWFVLDVIDANKSAILFYSGLTTLSRPVGWAGDSLHPVCVYTFGVSVVALY